jgi:hypothetical protein
MEEFSVVTQVTSEVLARSAWRLVEFIVHA